MVQGPKPTYNVIACHESHDMTIILHTHTHNVLALVYVDIELCFVFLKKLCVWVGVNHINTVK